MSLLIKGENAKKMEIDYFISKLTPEILAQITSCLNIWLDEDKVDSDITTELLDISGKGKITFFSKNSKPFILCGVPIVIYTFKKATDILGISNPFEIVSSREDGDLIKKGETILEIWGELKLLFALERLSLNIISRLSGIATETNKISRVLKRYGIELWATRKTTPGLRALEKYAVVVGGGKPHRKNLSDGILIKDNHITVIGGIKKLLHKLNEKRGRIRDYIGKGYLFEIEVQSEQELDDLLDVAHNFDEMTIMLDNFTTDELARSIKRIRDFSQQHGVRIFIEVSGGVRNKNVKDIAKLGPDRISAGYITFSPKNPDISANIEPAV